MATQVRLTVETTESLTAETPGDWELRDASGALVHQGTWPVRDGPLLISLPADQTLPPGQYDLLLTWQGEEMARHKLTLHPSAPVITDLSVSLTPEGPAESTLPAGFRVAYVTYRYENACAGSPFWLTVWGPDSEALCSSTGMLPALQGTGEMACYREDGAPFVPGVYYVEVTLTEETRMTNAFTVATPVVEMTPVPSPSSTPVPTTCSDLFAAAGITAEGDAFLPLTLFDWYTEVVYAGARCQDLAEETAWHSAWYLDGVLVREAAGRWQGAPDGVVWDSLTGQPDNPFLAPGLYTVTLTVADVPLTTTFSVFDYALRDTGIEGEVQTPIPSP